MIRTGGIDLGGTKIEAQKFDANWNVADKRRIDTPTTYHELIAAMVNQILWLQEGNPNLPVGIAAAGLEIQRMEIGSLQIYQPMECRLFRMSLRLPVDSKHGLMTVGLSHWRK